MFPIDLYFWDNYIMFNLIALKSNPTSPRIIVAFIYSHTFNLNNFGAKIVFECFFRIYSNNQSTLQTRTVFGISNALLLHVLFLFNSKSKPMYDGYSEICFLELRNVWSNKMSWFEYDYTDIRWICLYKMKGCLYKVQLRLYIKT